MREDIAKRWIEALPKYKQGQKNLRKGDEHCCMGVLCELAVKDGVTTRRVVDINTNRFGYGNWDTSYPPLSVCEWAGLSSREGGVESPTQLRNRHDVPFANLIDMNDAGVTFEEIAKAIEENWERL